MADPIRVTTQRRVSSDEQEKRPSQSETARKRSKFSGVRKTPAASSARPRNPFVPPIQREKILIWQGSSGVARSRCIRVLRDCTLTHHTLHTFTHQLSGRRRLQLLGDLLRFSPFCWPHHSILIGQDYHIVLNRPFSIWISDIDFIVRPVRPGLHTILSVC